MSDWKDKLKKFANAQGIKVEEPSKASQAPRFGRKLVRQTTKIEFNHNPKFNRTATAPYNFVPLNEKVITVQPFNRFDSYDTTHAKTGYIVCEIEAITPLYIRGTRGAEQYPEVKTTETSAFFSPGGEPRLPGSSLRGMVRNLVEIFTWSRLTTDLSRHYYYRGMADKSKLRDEYQSHMSSYDRKTKSSIYEMNAGYLAKVGTRYRITPAQTIASKQFHQILEDERKQKTPGEPKGRFTCYEFFRDAENYIVISGPMPKKKRDWVIYPPDQNATKIWIPEDDIRNYRLDENRQAVNLIAELDNDSQQVFPCFYVNWVDRLNNKRVSFGHTAMFRLAYQQSLQDLLPAAMNTFDAPDMAEAIFGAISKAGIQAGRVYFEDGILSESPAPEVSPAIPEILSSPKPTTFQHYLVQASDAVRELYHYNSAETFLRGHKLYWHRERKWQAEDVKLDRGKFEKFLAETGQSLDMELLQVDDEKIKISNFPSREQSLKDLVFAFVRKQKKEAQYTVIEALPPRTKFTAKIRFENLTKTELGALLFALVLPASCYHKIGMGKPLGLGSVKITSKLYLSERRERYASLRAEWADEGAPESSEIEVLKAEFEQEIIRQLEESERPATNQLWDTYRLKQLQKVLDWQNTETNGWDNKTRYLEIPRAVPGQDKPANEYKDRLVLPIPEKVAPAR